MLAVKGSHFISDDVLIGGSAYLRRYLNRNLSSNVNDNFDPAAPASPNNSQALNDRAAISQTSYGYGLQLTSSQPLAGGKNQLVLGTSGDFGRAAYTQEAQPADFTPSRGTVGTGEFAPQTDARTRTGNLSVYAMDSFSLTPKWTLTGSGRFNHATVSIRDHSGVDPQLNADHSFNRFNPAVGLTFNPSANTTAYASYNEGMRAPTAMELTCADPAAPCKLPNSFLADPPLKIVVAKTVELGARGERNNITWSAAIYRTELLDDIQFISSGRTLREGVELTAGTKFGSLSVVARYSFINATYRAGFVEHAPTNSSADGNGDIQVRSGDRIPGIPRQTLRLRLDYDVNHAASLGLNVLASASSRSRGDENGLDINRSVPGYAVINVDGRYRIAKGTELFARVNNLFDRRYANFGLLGRNVFTGPGRSFDMASGANEPFRGLGAPRGVWVGVRQEWE
jgi:outer membrane receptor protein involved in Fe transport